MTTAHSDRFATLPAHLGYSTRRPTGAERSRPSNRSIQSGRTVFLEGDPMARLSGRVGSMFDTAAPQRF